jgi:hypothetical protein
MKKILYAVMILGCISLTQKSYAQENAKVLGTWKIDVPDAPPEYAKCTLTFTEAEGKLAAKLVFEDGFTVKPPTVTFAKGSVNFAVTIEGSNIPVTGKVENNKITGKVDSPDGPLDFTAVRKEASAKK